MLLGVYGGLNASWLGCIEAEMYLEESERLNVSNETSHPSTIVLRMASLSLELCLAQILVSVTN